MTDESPMRFTPLDADGNPSGEPIMINGTGWCLTDSEGNLIAQSMPLNPENLDAQETMIEQLRGAGELHILPNSMEGPES